MLGWRPVRRSCLARGDPTRWLQPSEPLRWRWRSSSWPPGAPPRRARRRRPDPSRRRPSSRCCPTGSRSSSRITAPPTSSRCYLWVGVGRALREARSARLRPLPGAHALQGHRQVRARATSIARWRAWAAARTPSRPSTTPTFYILVPERRHRDGRRAARRHGLPLDLRSQGDRPRARGHLRGGAHRGGQSARPRSSGSSTALVFADNPYGRPAARHAARR